MKRAFVPYRATVLLLLTFLLTSCVRDVIYTVDDMYAPFPEAEILGASFYYQRDGKDVSGDEAGMISRNEDGTYHVKLRRRTPSSSPTAMFITGSFEFSEFYKITCTFPDDPAVTDKPYRVYACASRGMDGNIDADYPTASDLMGDAVFRNGVAIGQYTLTNEGINYLHPDPRGRPYITVFLYLYFANVSDPNDYYEFTLDFAGGANGKIPESVVTKAAVYRNGDAANKCEPIIENYEITDPYAGPVKKQFILANYNHRLDSRKLSPPVSVVDTDSLCIDLKVPDQNAGKELEFEIRGVGLYSNDDNLITADMIKAAKVEGSSQTPVIKETKIRGSDPPAYYYTIKAKTEKYADLLSEPGTGVKLVINGTDTFLNTSRFTCTISLPEKYIGQ